MSDHASPAAARRRTDVWFALGVLVAVGVLCWIVVTMQQLGQSLRTANDARDALARQVQGLGHQPVAGPPGSRGDPGQSVIGPRGPEGVPGLVGPTGPTGPAGPTGKTGVPGVSATGAPGTAGRTGAAGAKGDPGPSGAPGTPGKDGADGAPGKNGTDGTDGRPPAGWTYADPQGVQYTCTPASGFDPNAPRYTCAPASQPSPSPASRRGLLGVGALAMTGMYRRIT
ncbi:collagen-like protein [Streptomyces sp. NPDC057910]|uniref:collagen-like protein n=1 Tax=Streptomyces sp. NPDC057910 TaxID=3346278 RepID=UPI0036E2C26F